MRISHSGDGCGASWPLCHNELIPDTGQTKTWVEFLHRLTSGLFGIFVFCGFVLSLGFARALKNQSRNLKIWATIAFVLTIVEALLGAKLVLSGLVGSDESVSRLITMSLHQMNSLALMGAIFVWYWTSLDQKIHGPILRRQNILLIMGFVILAILGSWASFAATLFPAESLGEALQADLNFDSPWPIRLRSLHPFIAVAWGVFMIYYLNRKNEIKMRSFWIFAVLFGITMLLLLSPVWMKLLHLVFAQLLWLGILWIILKRASSQSPS